MADDSVDIDKLTDFEIRDKLKNLGFSFGIEIKVTRETLVAKLKEVSGEQTVQSSGVQGNPSSMQYSSGDDSQTEELPKVPKTSPRKKPPKQPEKDSLSNPSTNPDICTNEHPNLRISSERRSNLDYSESDSDIDVETTEDARTHIYESTHTMPYFLRNKGQRAFDKKVTRSRHKEPKERNRISSNRDTGPQRMCVDHQTNVNIDRDVHHNKKTPKYTCPPLYEHLLTNTISQEERRRRNNKINILIQSITVIGFLCFIYCVFMVKYGENHEIAAYHSDNNYYPICGQENVDASVCVEDVQLMPALDLANILVPKLREDAVEAYCNLQSYGHPVAAPSMSEEDALDYIKTKISSRKPAQLQKDLKNFKILVLFNPHWELKVVANGMNDIEKILFYGEFVAKQFPLPFACCVLRILFTIPSAMLLAVMVFAIAVGCIVVYHMYERADEEHRRNVYRIVHSISQAVYEQKRDVNAPDYMSIDHCRDLVLKLEPQPVSLRVWEDAVAFVKQHERRIRSEVRNVEGELVKVWTWVPPPKEPKFSE